MKQSRAMRVWCISAVFACALPGVPIGPIASAAAPDGADLRHRASSQFGSCDPSRPAPGSTARIIIDDQDLALWMTLQNSFASHDGDFPPRRGVLFQFGSFASDWRQGCFHFGGLTLSGRGQLEVTFACEEIEWVNVVAEHPDLQSEAMNAGHVPILYRDTPGQVPDAGDVCAEFDRCAMEACGPAGLDGAQRTPVLDGCLRGQQYSKHYVPHSVMTFWQGPGGFRFEAQASVVEGRQGSNRHCFTMPERVRVDVKRKGSDRLQSFPFGAVDTIHVKWRSGKELYPVPLQHGASTDPPWYP